jgi:uncharacterized protein YjbI with pentapeptide repeats
MLDCAWEDPASTGRNSGVTRSMVVAIFVILGLLVVGIGTALAIVLPRRTRATWGEKLDGKDLFDAENESRKNVLQVVGSLVVVLGLLATVSQFASTQRATDETLRLTEQGQVTDRFTRAIEALGATDGKGREQLEVRLGAIYSLDRLYADAPDVRSQVMDIIAAYVRRHSIDRADDAASVSEDVSAAFHTIEQHSESAVSVNLSGAAVDWSRLAGGHLAAPQFLDAHLADAYFPLWRLPAAQFVRAELVDANFSGACLAGASFKESDLRKADFRQADLHDASFDRAKVRGAKFGGANLRLADLRNAKGLKAKQLSDVIADSETQVDPELSAALDRGSGAGAPGEPIDSFSDDEAGYWALMHACDGWLAPPP